MPILQAPIWDRPAGSEGEPPSGWRGVLCRLGRHHWKTYRDTGYTRYLGCEWCGRHDIEQGSGGGYQPVDAAWITRGDFSPATDWGNLQLPTGSAGKPPRPTPPPPAATIPTERTPDYTRNLDILQAEVRLWTRKAFPQSTQVSRARHLLREAAELYAAVRLPEIIDFNDDSEILWGRLSQEITKEVNTSLSRIVLNGDPYRPGYTSEELADCLLILCDMAAAFTDVPGMEPWSLIAETRGKLREAKARRYGPPDSSGVSERVREDGVD